MYKITYINKHGLTLQKTFLFWYQVNDFISQVDWLRIKDSESSLDVTKPSVTKPEK